VITTLAALVVGPASSSAAVAGMVTLGSWLANKIADTLEARAEAKRQSEAQTESLFERVLTSCKTIDELCSTCSELRYNRTERIISCSICTQRINADAGDKIPSKFLRGANLNTFGIFKTDQEFKLLKHAVKQHTQTGGHLWCVEQEHRASILFQQRLDVGINVARTVYKGVLEADSHSRLEREIAFLADAGVEIGEKNHSRKFVPELCKAIYSTLRDSIHDFFKCERPETGRRPFLCINGDKLTCNRRTSQAVGCLTIVGGEIKAILLGAKLCHADLTGIDTAKGMYEVLNKEIGMSPVLIRSQVSGFAADGAYIHDHVDVQFARLAGLKQSWMLSRHDEAHKLELTVNDIRKNQRFQWYTEMSTKLSDLQTEFRYGKNYEEALGIATELGKMLRNPKYVCPTRFCASEVTVYRNFLENWIVFHTHKTDRWNAETNAAERNKLGAQLRSLDNFMWMCTLICLVDVLRAVSRLSLFVQLVNMLPWEKNEALARHPVPGCSAAANLAQRSDHCSRVSGF
jgi:hypothetical protein